MVRSLSTFVNQREIEQCLKGGERVDELAPAFMPDKRELIAKLRPVDMKVVRQAPGASK